MENKFPSHPITIRTVTKLSEIIDKLCPKKGKKEISLVKLSEKCQCTPEFLGYLRDGKRGQGIQLDYAIKIWEGLGHSPETLIADCNIDPLLAERLKAIQDSDWADFLDLAIKVLYDIDFIDNLKELAEIKGELKSVWRRIITKKEQQQANPGEKLSNFAGD